MFKKCEGVRTGVSIQGTTSYPETLVVLINLKTGHTLHAVSTSNSKFTVSGLNLDSVYQVFVFSAPEIGSAKTLRQVDLVKTSQHGAEPDLLEIVTFAEKV